MNKVGLGTRVANFLVDTLLIFGVAYGLYTWWIFHVMYWNYTFIPFYGFFFGFIFVYYTFFEAIFKRTPGKWLTFSKVVNEAGNKPSFIQIVIRSLIRITIIDCFFIPFLTKTLHDYVSKTEVVEV